MPTGGNGSHDLIPVNNGSLFVAYDNAIRIAIKTTLAAAG